MERTVSIMYQGLSDATIPAQSSNRFYEDTTTALKTQDLTGFFRYFPMPGMQHCWNSKANLENKIPWYIGGPGQANILITDFNTPNWGVSRDYQTAQTNALSCSRITLDKTNGAVEKMKKFQLHSRDDTELARLLLEAVVCQRKPDRRGLRRM
jgi:hypothetical protein